MYQEIFPNSRPHFRIFAPLIATILSFSQSSLKSKNPPIQRLASHSCPQSHPVQMARTISSPPRHPLAPSLIQREGLSWHSLRRDGRRRLWWPRWMRSYSWMGIEYPRSNWGEEERQNGGVAVGNSPSSLISWRFRQENLVLYRLMVIHDSWDGARLVSSCWAAEICIRLSQTFYEKNVLLEKLSFKQDSF